MGSYLLVALVIYAVWLVVGCSVQRAILYPRHMTQPEPDAGEGVPALERWWIETDAGRTEAWFLPAGDASGNAGHASGGAVIFAHGNAELIDDLPEQLEPYRALGVHVLLVEYRGYGRSDGRPSQRAITADFIKAYDRLARRADVDPRRIVFHGRSLGGGVLCALARRREPAAIILQSPFVSVTSIAAGYLIPPFLVRDPYDNAAALRGLDRPVLIVHGVRDTIVPIRHGRRLAEAARRATLLEYDCGHNDFPVTSPQYWRDVAGFLSEHGVLPADT